MEKDNGGVRNNEQRTPTSVPFWTIYVLCLLQSLCLCETLAPQIH